MHGHFPESIGFGEGGELFTWVTANRGSVADSGLFILT